MSMRTRITVLAENTVGGTGLTGEHGLSLWIEMDSHRVLFDTGQGLVIDNNARRLGVRLGLADAIVLSHGHYDHTGGLGSVLGRPGRIMKVFAHPEALTAKFGRSSDGTRREIGIASEHVRLVREQSEWVPTTEPTEICPHLHVTGPVPRVTEFEDTGGRFFKDRACTEPDDLVDDQAAFFDTSEGTVVILGCAHAGVINTLRYVRTLTADRPIHTVVGGMHLGSASPERLERTMAELRRLDVQRLLPVHCTGLVATIRMWNEFPDRCGACPVGTVLEIPG